MTTNGNQVIIAFLLEVAESAQDSANGLQTQTHRDPRQDAGAACLIEDAYSISFFSQKLAKYLSEDPQSVRDVAHATVLLGLEVMDASRQEVLKTFGNDGEKVIWN